MRTLRLVSLVVLIATFAFAADTNFPKGTPADSLFRIGVRNPTGNIDYQFVTQPDVIRTPVKSRKFSAAEMEAYLHGNTCYFIRSYIMKREGEDGATHLDHVTTCTPQSRIRMKTRVKFTPAVVK